jgi:hypothetical protein
MTPSPGTEDHDVLSAVPIPFFFAFLFVYAV